MTNSGRMRFRARRPRPRIASRLGARPARLAPLLAEQPVEKMRRRSRHARLREQRPQPTLHFTQRRRPQPQRRPNRRSRHPMISMPNYDGPVSQKSQKSTIVTLAANRDFLLFEKAVFSKKAPLQAGPLNYDDHLLCETKQKHFCSAGQIRETPGCNFLIAFDPNRRRPIMNHPVPP